MTELQIFLVILFVHYFADFILQTDEQANNKGVGKSLWNKYLFYHVLTYTLTWGGFFWILPRDPVFDTFIGWIVFMVFIGVPHYIVDWCTSRLGKPFWEKKDYHNGFAMVGFDQILHYICLLWVLFGIVNRV